MLICSFWNNYKPLQRLVRILLFFPHFILKQEQNEPNSTQTWHLWYSSLSRPTRWIYDITQTQSLAMMYVHGCLCVREIFKETNRVCGVSFPVRREEEGRHRWSRETRPEGLFVLFVPEAFFSLFFFLAVIKCQQTLSALQIQPREPSTTTSLKVILHLPNGQVVVVIRKWMQSDTG